MGRHIPSGIYYTMYLFLTDSKQCSKLAVAWLPEAAKISFGQPVFRKNKGPVARDCAAFAIRKTWIFFLIWSTELGGKSNCSFPVSQ